MKVESIPISKIIIPQERARATFTEEQHQELLASIKTHGFTVPILVMRNNDGTYTLIDGEHRVQVAKELGYKEVPAVVVEADTKKAIMLNVLANTARGTQNPMDVAECLKRAMEAGATVEELAAATGHTESWVKLYLTLNELPDVYKDALRNGKLKIGHIKEALRLPTLEEIDAALGTALNLGWTVSQLKYYVDLRLEAWKEAQSKGLEKPPEPPPTPTEAQRLIQYRDCMFCGRKIPVQEMEMNIMCHDCAILLKYITSQIGTGKEAMNTIYNALSSYFDMLRFKQYELIKQQSERVTPTPPTPQPQNPNTTKNELKQMLKELLLEMKQKGEI